MGLSEYRVLMGIKNGDLFTSKMKIFSNHVMAMFLRI
jgi:hypothetical protein